MKLIAATSPFPPILFFMQYLDCEEVIIEKYEHYQKGAYRNRFMIAAANGEQRITVPLKKGKNEQKEITAVEISYEEDWNRQAWQSIVSAYGRAPYFEHYAAHIQPFFMEEYTSLWAWNNDILKKIIQLLKIDLTYTYSPVYQKVYGSDTHDVRQTLRPSADVSAATFQKYSQLFEEKHGFLANLSILDLLFCAGPRAKDFLKTTSPLSSK